MKRKFLGLALMFFVGFNTQAQRMFTLHELKADAVILKKALVEAHAGLYRYQTKKQAEINFSLLEKGLKQPMTELQFYRYLNPFLVSIKDGHTKFHKQGQPDDLFAFSDKGYFPFSLYFIDNKSYMLSDNCKGIPAGAEIISVNGRSVVAIKDLLFRNIFVDGMGSSMKYALLNSSFAGYYGTFIETPDAFDVQYSDHGIKKRTVIPSVSKKQFNNAESHVAPYSMSIPKKGTALMEISGFRPDNSTGGFDEFLSKFFNKLKDMKVSNLILDLRNNEGGTDAYGIKLFSYLTDQPFNYYSKFTLAGPAEYSFSDYAEFPPELAYLKSFIKKVDGEYRFYQKEGLGLQQPNALNFKGKLIVLINGKSFSVTSEFASIVKDNRRAVFVGEETGGASGGNTSGAFALVTLPNTKLVLAVPLLGYHMSLKNIKNRAVGVSADYEIKPSVSELLKKNDTVMKKALSLSAQ